MPPSDTEAERLTPEAFWRWVWSSVRPYLGHLLVAIGFILVIVAYFGVSRQTFVARQVPYIVSGGLLGVAAVTLGSRLMLIEDLRRDSGRLERLETAVAELHAVLLARPDAPSLNGYSEKAASSPGQVIVLSGGQTFHRPDCTIVQGKKTASPVSTERAQDRGLAACKLCQPLSAGV